MLGTGDCRPVPQLASKISHDALSRCNEQSVPQKRNEEPERLRAIQVRFTTPTFPQHCITGDYSEDGAVWLVDDAVVTGWAAVDPDNMGDSRNGLGCAQLLVVTGRAAD